MKPDSKRVLMVLDGPFPPDPRVETEALALAEAGYTILLFCVHLSGHHPTKEKAAFGEIHRVRISRLMHKFSALAYTVPVYHAWLRKKLMPVLGEFKPHVVHIHDMQSARGVFDAVRAWGSNPKMVLDLHENRPEIMRHYHHVNTVQGKLLIHPGRWKKAEERYVNEADAVVVVTPEAGSELLSRPTVSQRNICDMPNTVSRHYAESKVVLPEAEARMEGKQNILYLGDTGKRRGIETAIRALALVKGEFPQAQLVLVGKSKADGEYASLAAALGVADRVLFEGWRFADLFPAYLRHALIGISPLHRNLHHDTTYANKIFQYMACGVALLVSDCPPQERIVRDFHCGRVHKAQNPESMANGLRFLLADSEGTQRLGRNGMHAIQTKLCRELQTANLVRCYKLLTESPLPHSPLHS